MATANLLDSLSQGMSPQFMQYSEKLLAVPHNSMVSAFGMALPALFAGIVQKGASQNGAENLMHVMERPELNPNIATDLDSYLGGGEKTLGLASLGQSMMPDIFGNKLNGIVNAIATASGLKMESASRLMALATPTVLSVLKGRVARDHMDAKQLSNMLVEQGPNVSRSMDSRLAGAFGAASPAAFVANLGAGGQRILGEAGTTIHRAGASAASMGSAIQSGGATVARQRGGLARWWPWALLAAVGVLLATQLSTCFNAPTTNLAQIPAPSTNTPVTFSLPNGTAVSAPDGGFIASLVRTLQGTDMTSAANYTLDEMYFDTGSAQVKAESLDQIGQLAQVMAAYPAVEIQVRGFTDSTGNATANQKLSADRADAVKQALIARGVDSGRITTTGMGEAHANTSGNAQSVQANRRVEITITKR